MPADLSAADLAHWQIRLQVDDLDALVERVEIFGGSIVGAGALELGAQQQAVGARRALQVADPDGHRLQLVEA
jgi:predicted enzyme related to lactoylglutathione lyase